MSPESHADFVVSADDPRPRVWLCARRSYIASTLAIHPWFVVFDPRTGVWETWEIWGFGEPTYRHETSDVHKSVTGAGRRSKLHRSSYGYIDTEQQLRAPVSGAVLADWQGTEAARILAVLRAPNDYPYRDSYRLWPGPNSNTYIAWVLRSARVANDLHPQAVGKDYIGPYGFGAGISTTRTGLQIESPFLGGKIGVTDGVEVHILCLTLGVDFWPLALKTPLGRIGIPEPTH